MSDIFFKNIIHNIIPSIPKTTFVLFAGDKYKSVTPDKIFGKPINTYIANNINNKTNAINTHVSTFFMFCFMFFKLYIIIIASPINGNTAKAASHGFLSKSTYGVNILKNAFASVAIIPTSPPVSNLAPGYTVLVINIMSFQEIIIKRAISKSAAKIVTPIIIKSCFFSSFQCFTNPPIINTAIINANGICIAGYNTNAKAGIANAIAIAINIFFRSFQSKLFM